MSKVKIEVVESRCRCNYLKVGDHFIVEDLCPPICHELWNCMYPYVLALQSGATLDYGIGKEKKFGMRCPDEGRVKVFGEVIENDCKCDCL